MEQMKVDEKEEEKEEQKEEEQEEVVKEVVQELFPCHQMERKRISMESITKEVEIESRL